MAKGTIAKSNVINKIKQVFGDDYIGEVGGKQYVWSAENGEKIQVAIALTCPKTPIDSKSVVQNDVELFGEAGPGFPKPAPAISQQELKNISDLMVAVGLDPPATLVTSF